MSNLLIQTETKIYKFRRTIPANSETARSIDRNDSWQRIVLIAKKDGYRGFAEQLEKFSQRALK